MIYTYIVKLFIIYEKQMLITKKYTDQVNKNKIYS